MSWIPTCQSRFGSSYPVIRIRLKKNSGVCVKMCWSFALRRHPPARMSRYLSMRMSCVVAEVVVVVVVVSAVRLRATRDEVRNGNKRPHSLVSISSSSSSGSSGFTGAMMLGFHGHQTAAASAAPGAVSASHLGSTLTTMHESPLELVNAARPAADRPGAIPAIRVYVIQLSRVV